MLKKNKYKKFQLKITPNIYIYIYIYIYIWKKKNTKNLEKKQWQKIQTKTMKTIKEKTTTKNCNKK